MQERRSQNSIIVLATLGVYLGLVLAGATPQVAAQRAAMARGFDITDEIEAKDDLDTKPEKIEAKKEFRDYTETVRKFLDANIVASRFVFLKLEYYKTVSVEPSIKTFTPFFDFIDTDRQSVTRLPRGSLDSLLADAK